MTININHLIDGPQEGFEERLKVFQKQYPEFFKEELVEIHEFFRDGEEKPYLVIDHEGVEHHYPYQGTALVRIQDTPQIHKLQMMLNVGQILIDFERGKGITSLPIGEHPWAS